MRQLPVAGCGGFCVDLYRTMALGVLGYRHLLAAHVRLFGWPNPGLGAVVDSTMSVIAARLPEVAT